MTEAFIPETGWSSAEPRDEFVVTGGEGGAVDVWAGAIHVLELTGHIDAVTAIAFAPAGHRLVTASSDHTLRVWELPPAGPDLIKLALARRTRDLTQEERVQFFLLPNPQEHE